MTDIAPANSPSASSIPADDPESRIDRGRSRRRRRAPYLRCRRHLHSPGVRRADCRTLLPGRHARARRRRPSAAPPRLRGDVHAARRRTRVHFSRQVTGRARGIDHQRSGQCPARLQERVRQDGPHAVHVYARGTGGILHGGRHSCREPHIAPASADPGRDWPRRAS